MNNNDILRRIRYTFNFTDLKMAELFNLSNHKVTPTQISCWLKKDDDPDYMEINDKQMSIFLNGFIDYKRGKKEGVQPKPEKSLNNNIILRKLKIALNLKDIDMINIFDLADMRISKHELSAFFRNPSQNQYRTCKDQFLRNFLYGMQIKYRKNKK